ncbi:MAG: hypothetical protein MJH11_05645, partial [Lentisphaeria bacterium]|nr:hypothetical protein [Lentisphaeria bacterium]
FYHTIWNYKSSQLSTKCVYFRYQDVDFDSPRENDVFVLTEKKKVFKVGHVQKQKVSLLQ